MTASVSAVAEPAPGTRLRTLKELEFDNTFTNELPGDPLPHTGKRRQVNEAFYSFVTPTSTGETAQLVMHSPEVARIVGLNPAECLTDEFAAVMSGNAILPATQGKSWAQNYGGHQFGYWAGQLGDGRAISLGQVLGADNKNMELQLKGAGSTPYSRTADGRAVLRSSVREFIASEAMAALGVPTTRALSLTVTGGLVTRDMFYNGNIRDEPGAVVCRVAPCLIRFGTFQLPASRGENHLVTKIADYLIKHHYPHLEGSERKYQALLTEVVERTGRLVAAWQGFGFVHGVLNTDNMSMLGETIDYGPYGFLERFDPNFTPNTSDLSGKRYTFRNQPEMGQWNLAQLANAFVKADLLNVGAAQEALEKYSTTLAVEYNSHVCRKLGLKAYNRDVAVGLLTAMYEDDADFSNTFRALSGISTAGTEPLPQSLAESLGELSEERTAEWVAWVAQYRAVLQSDAMDEAERQAMQNAANPAFIPRNHVMQDAIALAEDGDFAEVNRLMEVLRRPFDHQPGFEKYRVPAPRQSRMGVELLSCSS